MKNLNKKNHSRLRRIIYNYKLYIFSWFALSWGWVFQTDNSSFTPGSLSVLFIKITMVALVVLISSLVMIGTISLINHRFKDFGKPSNIVIAWFLLAFADFAAAWINNILWIGAQGRIDSILPFGSPTLLAVNTVLGYATRIIGFHGLAGLLWLLLYVVWNRKTTKKVSYMVALCLIILSSFGWLLWRSPNGGHADIKIIRETLDDRVGQLTPGEADLVVFPEYGLDNQDDREDMPRFKEVDDPVRSYYIGSQQEVVDGVAGHYNTLIYGNTSSGATMSQNKYRLIVNGEYLPYIIEAILRLSHQNDKVDEFYYSKAVHAGDKQLLPFKISRDFIVGSGVCSSVTSPGDYRYLAGNSTLLSNSASLTTFKNSKLFSFQQKSLAKFMAVSNSRYFVQSANSADAFVINNNGQVEASTSKNEVLDVDVKLNSKKTPYTVLGDFAPIVGGLILSIMAVMYVVDTKLMGRKKDN